MGTKGTVASATALAVLLQEGNRRPIRVSLTPQPGEARTQEVVVALEILQSLRLRAFNPSDTACPAAGPPTTSTTSRNWPADRTISCAPDAVVEGALPGSRT